jgi:preprotein translocase subunit SecE
VSKDNIILFAGLTIVAVVFAVLWRKGYFLRLSRFFVETREELLKCTWPTPAELRGSTVVVMVAMIILGAYTVMVDFAITTVVHKGLLGFFN